jgi:hypothetical protein
VTKLPSDAELVRLAGYRSTPARVLTSAVKGTVAAVLIDTNGDGRLIEFQGLWLDDGGKWQAGSSSGAGSYGEGDLGDEVMYRYRCDTDGDRWVIELAHEAGGYQAVWPEADEVEQVRYRLAELLHPPGPDEP